MTTTRYPCPLDCGWYHDEDPADRQFDFAPFIDGDPPVGADPLVAVAVAGRLVLAETVVREHFATHDLAQWFTALSNARGRAIRAERAVMAVDRAMRRLDIAALTGVHDALAEWKGER